MIKFIGEEDLLEIKNNQKILFNDVITGKKTALEEAFHNDQIIRSSNVPGDEFRLDMSAEKPELTDYENAKRVYNNMHGMSESQAADERIWAAYTLSVFKDYMAYRWAPQSEVEMMNRYFFSYSPKRSLFRNGIARLWWIAHLTYDPKRTGNKFELTEYVCKKQDNINLLLDIGFGNNRVITHATIQALLDHEKNYGPVDRETLRRLSEYINTLGGIYLIDMFDFQTIYDRAAKKLNKSKGSM